MAQNSNQEKEYMTENLIGKRLFVLWVIILEIIPTGILILLFKRNNFFNTKRIMILGIILVITNLVLYFLLRRPFSELYKKDIWEYNGNELYNPFKNISIKNNEISKIYVGIEENKNVFGKFPFLFKKDIRFLVEVAKANTIVIIKTDNTITFFKLALLRNGLELQNNFLKNNEDKIESTRLNFDNYRKKGIRKKLYIEQKIKEAK
jgi:hypothetical protein